MRSIRNWFLGILAALAVALGFYDGIYAEDNNVSGFAPTTNTDGSALTDLASIVVYKALSPNCDTAVYSVLATLPVTEAGAQFQYLDAGQNQNGRYCYKAAAVDSEGNVSGFSNIAFKDVDLIAPSEPTGLTVQ